MGRIVVVGGGWSGCAAAIRCKKQGHEVVLLEKTDLLLGLGNVGGIMRNNGRYTATEENIALGAKELFKITDRCSTHRNVDFPGHNHASFYDVALVEPEVRKLLKRLGIQLRFMTRAIDVEMEETCSDKKTRKIKRVVASTMDYSGEYGQEIFEGEAFVETTGSAGPMGNCSKYGNGCSMCILRCPAFGPRVSLTEQAGNTDLCGERKNGKPGAFSGSCKIEKRTLGKKLRRELEKEGFVVLPLPKEMVHKEKLEQKVCQQYALDPFAENVIIIDTGEAKLMTSYFNLEELRQLEELEKARFVDPYAGGKGNSIRHMAVGERNKYMQAVGIENLFLGGEKSGFFVGHTEAITTGSLAGYNAGKYVNNGDLLELPEELAVGDILKYANASLSQPEGFRRRLTFAGGAYFQRMQERQLYLQDKKLIRHRVISLGLENIYQAL